MPLKVLVIDDTTFIRDMVKRTLRQMVTDLELFEAPDGTRALSLIKAKKPDLILSDWEIPEISGEQLLNWVREQPDFADTPFVMITSRGDRDHVMAAVNAGVSDFLSKPFTPEELTRKIAKQLRAMGHSVNARGQPAINRGVGFASVDVLTGGKSAATKSTAQTAKPNKPALKGKAVLHFSNASCTFEVREMSIQALGGSMARPDVIPTVFEQASVELMDQEGEAQVQLDAYIHSISAAEPNPNAEQMRIIVRFVDKDPDKLAILTGMMG